MPKGSLVITEGPHGKGLCGKSPRHSLIQSGLSSWALSAAQKLVSVRVSALCLVGPGKKP